MFNISIDDFITCFYLIVHLFGDAYWSRGTMNSVILNYCTAQPIPLGRLIYLFVHDQFRYAGFAVHE
jgi:hypothetical protein